MKEPHVPRSSREAVQIAEERGNLIRSRIRELMDGLATDGVSPRITADAVSLFYNLYKAGEANARGEFYEVSFSFISLCYPLVLTMIP